MKHSSNLAGAGITRTVLFAFTLATTLFASGAPLQQGDEIKLTRDEPLYFRDKVFRQGKAGETFSVLGYRLDTKKVFVGGTDKDGKQIALTISEAAVAPVPADPGKIEAQAVEAAKMQRFPEALRLIAQAIRADRQNPRLVQTLTAIGDAQTASLQVERAKAEERRVANDVLRIRKNAA